jgi:hypothetical protein
VELLVLTYCDIRTVLNFSYCNHEIYELVHNSNWLWEQHVRAEATYNIEENLENWKAEYIELYTTVFDLLCLPEQCRSHCTVNKGTISRDLAENKHTEYWEQYLSKKTILPNTVTHVEFLINRVEDLVPPNAYKVCVGIESKDKWVYNKKEWHEEIVGAGGFCVIIGTGQISIRNRYHDTEWNNLKVGDRIGFIVDNGFSNRNIVTVRKLLNGEESNLVPVPYHLPVTEYKAGVSMCKDQSVTLTMMRQLKRKQRHITVCTVNK